MPKKKSPINIDPDNEGNFTANAKRHKMSVAEFAAYVLTHKDEFPASTRKQANFARNASHWNHKSAG